MVKIKPNKSHVNEQCVCLRKDRKCEKIKYCNWCRDHHLVNGGHPACYDNNLGNWENWLKRNNNRIDDLIKEVQND